MIIHRLLKSKSVKKTISILVLSVFIYNAIGFLALYPVLSGYYKYLGLQSVEKPKDKELVETLIFNKADITNGRVDFRWIHSREFKYNGDMYDMVEKKETATLLILYCVNDEKEKDLENNFQNKLEENTGNKKQRANRIELKKIISEPICFLIPEKLDFRSLKYKAYIYSRYNQISKEILTPPPQNVLA